MCTAKGRVPGEKPGTSAACREAGPQRAIIAKASYSALWRHRHKAENDRLLRALGSMGRMMQADGKVEFRGDAHAERFADELRQRYGKGVVAELASGRTDALIGDFEDADQRKWIARSVVSAAKSHVAFGLTLKEARDAERLLTSSPARGEHDWER